MFKDSFYSKIKEKTNIDKETIYSIANKVQSSDIKNEKVLNDLIDELSLLTGKKVSDEKRNKIINLIKNDKVPNNIDNIM